MKCKNIEIRLFEYAEGNLSVSDIRDIEKHLETCNACREAVINYKNALNIIDKESREEVKPFIFTRIEGKLQAKNNPGSVKWKIAPLFISAVTFGLIFGFFISSLYISRSKTSSQEYDMSYLFNDIRIENVEYNLTRE